MKIIQVHNYYQQAGGEDAVVAAERALLEEHGQEVIPYYKDNEALGSGLWALVKASIQTLWNRETYREFRELLKKERPDVVHCHNTFPLISPSIYWACAKEKVPVVQTLHNYRLLCLNAFLFKHNSSVKCEDLSVKQSRKTKAGSAGSICELCVKKSFKWPGIKYGCYRDSKAGSLVVALLLFFHKLIGTWSKKVTAYIALTEFQKQKMIEGGLPGDKIWVKPNFIDRSLIKESTANSHLPLAFETDSSNSSESSVVKNPYCLFVGRLSPEKGCDVLIRAWNLFITKLQTTNSTRSEAEAKHQQRSGKLEAMPELIIVGDGPERANLESLSSSQIPNAQSLVPESIRFLGKKPKSEVLSLMHNAEFLVLPSLWYEGFPMTIVEAFSCGLPVVASNDGGMKDIVTNACTGLLFSVGSSSQLAEEIDLAFSQMDKMEQMGDAAFREYEQNFSAVAGHIKLMQVYSSILTHD